QTHLDAIAGFYPPRRTRNRPVVGQGQDPPASEPGRGAPHHEVAPQDAILAAPHPRLAKRLANTRRRDPAAVPQRGRHSHEEHRSQTDDEQASRFHPAHLTRGRGIARPLPAAGQPRPATGSHTPALGWSPSYFREDPQVSGDGSPRALRLWSH